MKAKFCVGDVLSRLKVMNDVIKHAKVADRSFTIGGENRLSFRTEAFTLLIKLIEGEFPNYERVIPEADVYNYICNRSQLGNSIGRILAGRPNNGRIVFNFSQSDSLAKISAMSDLTTIIKSSTIFPFETTKSGGDEPFEIAFNGFYLLDFIRKLKTESVSIGLTAQLGAGSIRPVGRDDIQYLLMPMQIM